MAERKRHAQMIGSRLVQAGFVLVLVALWYLATHRWGVNHLLLPDPIRVWHELVDIIGSGEFIADLRVTLGELAIAFAISTIGGITLGYVISRSS
jgi:ABC-type nitrate/sulfonate/bicarbonate transport system permease component